jgi:hypothetical protein
MQVIYFLFEIGRQKKRKEQRIFAEVELDNLSWCYLYVHTSSTCISFGTSYSAPKIGTRCIRSYDSNKCSIFTIGTIIIKTAITSTKTIFLV